MNVMSKTLWKNIDSIGGNLDLSFKMVYDNSLLKE